MKPATKHSSHDTRFSDASSYDYVCVNCGAHDISGAGWGDLALPCPNTNTTLKPEKPATGISQTIDNPDFKCYHVTCECTTESHAVDTYVTVEAEWDVKQVSVTFSVNTYSHPLAGGFWQRVKNAFWVILGCDQQQHEIVMNKQQATNWAHAVLTAVKEIEKNEQANKSDK
jgi:hypothetical protein